MPGPRIRARSFALVGVLAATLLASAAPAGAASPPIGVWKLKGNLVNKAGTALQLTKVRTPTFQTVDVDGTTRKALVLKRRDGLRLSRIPNAARRTYTIDVWLEYNNLDGYRRILSFGPNNIDKGLYFDDAYLDLYDNKESSGEVVTADEWVHVRVTRDDDTKRMRVYLDGVEQIRFNDADNEYLLRRGIVVFFQDDGTEHPAGTAAGIKVWKRVVTPS